MGKRERLRNLAGIILSILVVLVACSNPFRAAFSYPAAITVLTGQLFEIDTGYPVVSVRKSGQGDTKLSSAFVTTTKLTMDTGEPGQYFVEFRLLGLIPIRKVSLTVTEPVMVVPGGHSIGVILRSTGLVISGLSSVETQDGRQVWPARGSGLQVGDVILSAGDTRVSTKDDLSFLVDQAGRAGSPVDILVEKQDGSTARRSLMPIQNKNGGYNIGLLVKDALAGVGTLTFYDPKTGVYAALGHVISEGDSRRPVTMKEGQIVRATVTGIEPSRKGDPGEVLGTFVEGQDVIGNIMENGVCGITGILSGYPVNPLFSEPIPLGFETKLKRGHAEMLTTVNGTSVERFSIEIEQIFKGTNTSSKGFVIRITDKRLLSLTSGIVQGMSGSPIIQDGYLVGAVTHVLVNDPTRGYGTFAEWMAKDSRLFPANSRNDAAAACAL